MPLWGVRFFPTYSWQCRQEEGFLYQFTTRDAFWCNLMKRKKSSDSVAPMCKRIQLILTILFIAVETCDWWIFVDCVHIVLGCAQLQAASWTFNVCYTTTSYLLFLCNYTIFHPLRSLWDWKPFQSCFFSAVVPSWGFYAKYLLGFF